MAYSERERKFTSAKNRPIGECRVGLRRDLSWCLGGSESLCDPPNLTSKETIFRFIIQVDVAKDRLHAYVLWYLHFRPL